LAVLKLFGSSPFVLQDKTKLNVTQETLNRTIHVQLCAVLVQIFSGNDNFDI